MKLEENEEEKKKSGSKKQTFWIVIVVVVAVIGLAFGLSKTGSSHKSSSHSETSSSKSVSDESSSSSASAVSSASSAASSSSEQKPADMSDQVKKFMYAMLQYNFSGTMGADRINAMKAAGATDDVIAGIYPTGTHDTGQAWPEVVELSIIDGPVVKNNGNNDYTVNLTTQNKINGHVTQQMKLVYDIKTDGNGHITFQQQMQNNIIK